MMDKPPRTFGEAEKCFQSFLESNGFNSDIRWVFREDVAMRRGEYLIRCPIPESNRAYARKLFYVGLDRALGYKLSCLAIVNNVPVCYLLVPEDATDAEYKMLEEYSVQFSYPDPPKTAESIHHGLSWYYWKWKSNKWLTYLPYRKQLGSTDIPAELLPPTSPKCLFVVEGHFRIQGRGLFLLPGILIELDGPFPPDEIIFRIGDKVELRRPDGSVLNTEIAGAEWLTRTRTESEVPRRSSCFILQFSEQLEPSDAPVGTEVWIVES